MGPVVIGGVDKARTRRERHAEYGRGFVSQWERVGGNALGKDERSRADARARLVQRKEKGRERKRHPVICVSRQTVEERSQKNDEVDACATGGTATSGGRAAASGACKSGQSTLGKVGSCPGQGFVDRDNWPGVDEE